MAFDSKQDDMEDFMKDRETVETTYIYGPKMSSSSSSSSSSTSVVDVALYDDLLDTLSNVSDRPLTSTLSKQGDPTKQTIGDLSKNQDIVEAIRVCVPNMKSSSSSSSTSVVAVAPSIDTFATAEDYDDLVCQLELRIANEDIQSPTRHELEARLHAVLSQDRPIESESSSTPISPPGGVIVPPPLEKADEAHASAAANDGSTIDNTPVTAKDFQLAYKAIVRQNMASLMTAGAQNESKYSIHGYKHTMMNLFRDEAFKAEIPVVYASPLLRQRLFPPEEYRHDITIIEASLLSLAGGVHTSICEIPFKCEFRRVDCGLLSDKYATEPAVRTTYTQHKDDINSSEVSLDVLLDAESDYYVRERDLRRLRDMIRRRLDVRTVVKPAAIACFTTYDDKKTILTTQVVWIHPLQPLKHVFDLLEVYTQLYSSPASIDPKRIEPEVYLHEVQKLHLPLSSWQQPPVAYESCVGRYYQKRLDDTVQTLQKSPLRNEFTDQEWRYLVYRDDPVPVSMQQKRSIPMDQLFVSVIRRLFQGFGVTTNVRLASDDEFHRIHPTSTYETHSFQVNLQRELLHNDLSSVSSSSSSSYSSSSVPATLDWNVYWDNLLSWIRLLYAFLCNIQKALLPKELGTQTIWMSFDHSYCLHLNVAIIKLEREALLSIDKVRTTESKDTSNTMTMRQLESLICQRFQQLSRQNSTIIHQTDSIDRLTDQFQKTHNISIRTIDICDVETEMVEEVSVFTQRDCDRIVSRLCEEEKSYAITYAGGEPLQFGLVFASGQYRSAANKRTVTHVVMQIIVLFPRTPEPNASSTTILDSSSSSSSSSSASASATSSGSSLAAPVVNEEALSSATYSLRIDEMD
jgi:hypothetical protein